MQWAKVSALGAGCRRIHPQRRHSCADYLLGRLNKVTNVTGVPVAWAGGVLVDARVLGAG